MPVLIYYCGGGNFKMTSSQTYAIISGWQLYDVYIGNNYYDGRYSNYHYKAYRVIAQSDEQAKQIVLSHADYVLEYFLKLKYKTGRRLLSKSKALPITEKRIGNTRLDTSLISTADYVNVLSPAGLIKVMFEDYKIKDIIFPEEEHDELTV